VLSLDRIEPHDDLIEGRIPRDPLERLRPLGANALERIQQPVGMMHALGIARDLGADDAGRIGMVLGPAHPADAAIAQ
jgi:hypothetical protein